MEGLTQSDHMVSAQEIAERSSSCCVALRARRMSRIVTRIYDDAMRPLGMTSSQFTLLTCIAQQDGVTAAEIGFDLDIEKSTLSRNLKRLVALKLMTMDPPAGRRGRGLHLTDKGVEALQAAFPIWRATQSRVTETMGGDSTGTFDRLLTSAERLIVD
jgi:DNA-binding MarR family transcriptional regulator